MRAWYRDSDIDFSGILLDENYIKKNTKIFQFIAFHTKLPWV